MALLNEIIKTKEKIIKLLSGDFSEKDLEGLILRLATLMIPMVRARQYEKIKLEGYEPRDIAFITIASLLTRDPNGKFIVLEKLFLNLDLPLASIPDEFFCRLLASALSRRLREAFFALARDIWPEKAKLRRDLLSAVKNSSNFYLEKKENGIFIHKKRNPSSSRMLPLSQEDILRICMSSSLWGLQAPKFISRLYDALESEQMAGLVRLRDLVDVYSEMHRMDEFYTAQNAQNDLSSLRDLSSPGLFACLPLWLSEMEEMSRKIIARYILKNKIPLPEKEGYLAALKGIISDWLEGRKERSFYGYLSFNCHTLDSLSYRSEKRKILEYLVRKSKEFLKEKARLWQNSIHHQNERKLRQEAR